MTFTLKINKHIKYLQVLRIDPTPSKKIRETTVFSYNAGISEVELLKKMIRGLSPVVCHHDSNLQEKRTTARKLGFEIKSCKAKEFEMNLQAWWFKDIHDLTTLSR